MKPLCPRTIEQYRSILRRRFLPTFGNLPIRTITPHDVQTWHLDQTGVRGKGKGRPTPVMSAQSYDLLQTIMKWAARRGVIEFSPCQMEGAGTVQTTRRVIPATVAEVDVLTQSMPDRFREFVTLGTWCAFRFGEIVALQRRDIDLVAGTVDIYKGAVRLSGQGIVEGPPKTGAGVRKVAIPPHVLPDIRRHIEGHVAVDPRALVFPNQIGGFLAQTTFSRHWSKAVELANRPGLHFHDLRHTGATMAGQAGATIAELQNRLGHSTVQAAMRYQHATMERDMDVARKVSALAGDPTIL